MKKITILFLVLAFVVVAGCEEDAYDDVRSKYEYVYAIDYKYGEYIVKDREGKVFYLDYNTGSSSIKIERKVELKGLE